MANANYDLVVFGASGATGLHVVSQAADAGLRVLAVDHEDPTKKGPAGQVDHVTADILDDEIDQYVSEAERVISAIGVAFTPTTALNPPPLYTDGVNNILKSMERTGTNRLALISAAFVDEEQDLPPWFWATVKQALRPILREMSAMERLVANADGITATIARPGWLLEKPLTGDYSVSDRALPEGVIRTRHADLADFLVKAVTEDEYAGRTLYVGRNEGLFDESILATAREIEKLAKKAS